MASMQKLFIQGGSGSGFKGHAGRPGMVGGSRSSSHGSFEGVFEDFMKEEDKKLTKELQEKGKVLDKELATIKKHRTRVEKVAEELGFPADRILSTEEKGYYFTVGNSRYQAGADYNPKTGKVQVFNIDEMSDADMRGILSHEIQHARWNDYLIAKQKGEDWAKSIDVDFYSHTTGWNKNLIETDGVTPYSELHWKNAIKTKSLWDETVAVDETLAEIARLKVTDSQVTIDPVWEDLYTRVYRGNVTQNKLFVQGGQNDS